MSLKNLLAAGQGLIGVTEQSRYQFSAENRLPVFEARQQPTTSRAAEPAHVVEEAPQKELSFERPVKIAPERRTVEAEPEERRGFLRRRRPAARPFTQSELGLENVKVVRNDLSDADLELAPRRLKTVEADLNPFAPRPIAAMGRPTHERQSFWKKVGRLMGFGKKGSA